MSDYLVDLIKRTEEPLGTIRPRLGSIFEAAQGVRRGLPELGTPVSPWIPVDSELEAEQAVSLEAPATDHTVRTIQPATRRSETIAPSAKMIGSETDARTIYSTIVAPAIRSGPDDQAFEAGQYERFQRVQRTVTAPPLDRSPSVIGRPIYQPPVSSSSFASVQWQESGHHSNVIQEGRTPISDVGHSPGESQNLRPQQAPSIVQPVSAVERRTANMGKLDEAHPSRPDLADVKPSVVSEVPVSWQAASPPAGQLVQPRIALAPRVREHSGVPATLSPEPPVIKVTIGRIEVRANAASQRPAPAPARPPSRPRPALSLDDYLKQRGGSR